MAMSEDDIQTGWIYRTSHLQERLVLGRDRDNRVVYVSKGRNAAAPFENCHVRVTGRRFAERAIGKVRFIEDVRPYIVANKATTVVLRERRAPVRVTEPDVAAIAMAGSPSHPAAAQLPADDASAVAADSQASLESTDVDVARDRE